MMKLQVDLLLPQINLPWSRPSNFPTVPIGKKIKLGVLKFGAVTHGSLRCHNPPEISSPVPWK